MSTDPITEKQVKYILFLMDTRNVDNLPERQAEWLKANRDGLHRMNREQAGKAIEALQLCDELPRNEVRRPVAVEVPEGRYWIVDPADGVEKFIKVDKPDKGRWSGYTFVAVQASDDFYPIKDPTHRNSVLAEIAKDPIESMNQYGIRLGVCGNCGRTLTARDSRLLGIGPVCAAKLGVKYGGVQLDANQLNLLLESEDE